MFSVERSYEKRNLILTEFSTNKRQQFCPLMLTLKQIKFSNERNRFSLNLLAQQSKRSLIIENNVEKPIKHIHAHFSYRPKLSSSKRLHEPLQPRSILVVLLCHP